MGSGDKDCAGMLMCVEKQILDALMDAKVAEYIEGEPLVLNGETEVVLDLFAEHAGYYLYFGNGIGMMMKWRPEDLSDGKPAPMIAVNVSPCVSSAVTHLSISG